MSNETANLFLLSWDMNGLESCINVTELEKANTWAVLSNSNPTHNLNQMVNMIMLRAKFNSQRHYEIYTIWVTDGITVDDMREMFEQDPQSAVDLIRSRGNKMYSDRIEKHRVKIT